MIIAIPTKTSGEKSFVSENFGRCNFFYIYDTETKLGKVYTNVYKDGQGGVGIKSSEFIINKGAKILITPRVGEKSLGVLRTANIKIFECTNEIVKSNIESYLNNELLEII